MINLTYFYAFQILSVTSLTYKKSFSTTKKSRKYIILRRVMQLGFEFPYKALKFPAILPDYPWCHLRRELHYQYRLFISFLLILVTLVYTILCTCAVFFYYYYFLFFIRKGRALPKYLTTWNFSRNLIFANFAIIKAHDGPPCIARVNSNLLPSAFFLASRNEKSLKSRERRNQCR